MFYYGATEWYFWIGVESGLNARISRIKEWPELEFWTNNKMTKACQDSHQWGFCLGVALTPEEYQYLTSWPESDIVCPVVEIAKEIIKTEPLEIDESNFLIIGRC